MLYQLVSLVGAAMILAAYVAYQRGRMGREDTLYNLLNFAGSGLLTWIAAVDRRWGFIILEGSWALLSLWPLLRPAGNAKR
ncbi:hypothetical protein J421_2312 [Gemmatirosa kalamazoonensis]|uniref:CBU-0592-like domain-containing protein n=1 Tax=Gemmatirosa kalamazoonensis TaxID=861299 RepID=W0RFI4_9BACT|nr:hypothetical protein [Gemmatirosa kalamazoonensis]AHG89849.1 hypothetical protein J421_2312 [Gemmatirosa kalamazoonensis]